MLYICHTVYNLLRLAFFIFMENNALELHLSSHNMSRIYSFILLSIIPLYRFPPVCLTIPLQRAFGLFSNSDKFTNKALQTCCYAYRFLCGHQFSLPCNIFPRRVIAELYSKWMFCFIRNFQTIFQSSYTIYIPTKNISEI